MKVFKEDREIKRVIFNVDVDLAERLEKAKENARKLGKKLDVDEAVNKTLEKFLKKAEKKLEELIEDYDGNEDGRPNRLEQAEDASGDDMGLEPAPRGDKPANPVNA